MAVIRLEWDLPVELSLQTHEIAPGSMPWAPVARSIFGLSDGKCDY
jgi:hypothetical protein